jgi:hypothetical protein
MRKTILVEVYEWKREEVGSDTENVNQTVKPEDGRGMATKKNMRMKKITKENRPITCSSYCGDCSKDM